MIGIEKEIRRRIYEVLKEKYTVYEDVPDTAKCPYVVISNSTSEDWSTKTQEGVNLKITIYVWSTYKGFKEVLDMAHDIIDRVKGLVFENYAVIVKLSTLNLAEVDEFKCAEIEFEFKVA